jgi:hypothetical protein
VTAASAALITRPCHLERRPALHEGQVRHVEEREGHAERDRRREHGTQQCGAVQGHADRGDDACDRHRSELTDLAHRGSDRDARRHRTGALDRGDHAEERRRPVQALVDQGKDRHLGHPHEQRHDRRSDREPAQVRGGHDVPKSRAQIRPEPGARTPFHVLGPDRQKEAGGDDEGGRVESRHRVPAGQRVQTSARQRRHQPRGLLRGLQQPVRVAELVLDQHPHEQPRSRRLIDDDARPVQERDEIDLPDVRATAHP